MTKCNIVKLEEEHRWVLIPKYDKNFNFKPGLKEFELPDLIVKNIIDTYNSYDMINSYLEKLVENGSLYITNGHLIRDFNKDD